MRDVPLAQIAEYAAEDADVTLKLKHFFAPELKKTGIESLFFDIEMPLIYVLAEMELTGVKLDTVALKQSSEELTAALNNLEKEIYELAGVKFNINSSKQVGEVLFEHLKIEEKAKKDKNRQLQYERRYSGKNAFQTPGSRQAAGISRTEKIVEYLYRCPSRTD